MNHFLNESGNIPKKVPKEAREISAFFSLVIDETMEKLPSTLTSTGIRCFRKRCTGVISSQVDLDNNEIFWKCSKCRNNGTITDWWKTGWNISENNKIGLIIGLQKKKTLYIFDIQGLLF